MLREIERFLVAEKTFELVTYEKSNRIAWITIRNESRMNALSTGVLNGLYDSFAEADSDDDVLSRGYSPQDRPWAVDGQLAVRKISQLTLSFDHRVCDGGTAGGFLRTLADYIEQPVNALGDL